MAPAYRSRMCNSREVHQPKFARPGSGVKSFFDGVIGRYPLLTPQNCMMAHSGCWAFSKKWIFSKCSTWRGDHHALLKGRKGPCTKTTKRKTFDSKARLSPGTTWLLVQYQQTWLAEFVTCLSHYPCCWWVQFILIMWVIQFTFLYQGKVRVGLVLSHKRKTGV